MFVGHYGPSFAAKALEKSVPLWVLFLAVQLVDVFWAIFVLLGIEKVRIVPGITAASPLDLYYMPYTHSAMAAILWSAAAAVAYRALRGRGGWTAAGMVGGAVLSHWVLDLLVHRPDLPLYDDRFKVGLGLWDYRVGAFVLEGAVLFGGVYLYSRVTAPVRGGGRYALMSLGAVMLALEGFAMFGPPPSSDQAAALSALAAYVVLAGGAYWVEGTRA